MILWIFDNVQLVVMRKPTVAIGKVDAFNIEETWFDSLTDRCLVILIQGCDRQAAIRSERLKLG